MALTVLGTAFAGCFSGDQSFDVAAPTWKAGDTWTYGFEGSSAESTFTVLNPSMPVSDTTFALLLQDPSESNSDRIDEGSTADLHMVGPGLRISTIGLASASFCERTGRECDKLQTTKAISDQRPYSVWLDFPLRPGKTWSGQDPANSQNFFAATVKGQKNLDLPGLGRTSVIEVHFDISYRTEWGWEASSDTVIHYSPEYQAIVKAKGVLDPPVSTLASPDPWHAPASNAVVLRSYERKQMNPYTEAQAAEILAGKHGGTNQSKKVQPPPSSESTPSTYDLFVTQDGDFTHPARSPFYTRFEVVPWGLRNEERIPLGHRVVMELYDDKGKLVASKGGNSWVLRFDEPGIYGLRATAWDERGALLDETMRSIGVADDRLQVWRTCATSSDAACRTLKFPVGTGRERLFGLVGISSSLPDPTLQVVIKDPTGVSVDAGNWDPNTGTWPFDIANTAGLSPGEWTIEVQGAPTSLLAFGYYVQLYPLETYPGQLPAISPSLGTLARPWAPDYVHRSAANIFSASYLTDLEAVADKPPAGVSHSWGVADHTGRLVYKATGSKIETTLQGPGVFFVRLQGLDVAGHVLASDVWRAAVGATGYIEEGSCTTSTGQPSCPVLEFEVPPGWDDVGATYVINGPHCAPDCKPTAPVGYMVIKDASGQVVGRTDAPGVSSDPPGDLIFRVEVPFARAPVPGTWRAEVYLSASAGTVMEAATYSVRMREERVPYPVFEDGWQVT